MLALTGSNGAGRPATLAPVRQPRRAIVRVGRNDHKHTHEFAESGCESPMPDARCPMDVVNDRATPSLIPMTDGDAAFAGWQAGFDGSPAREAELAAHNRRQRVSKCVPCFETTTGRPVTTIKDRPVVDVPTH
jgi:hypothetical protein